jgi:hypothetical protein
MSIAFGIDLRDFRTFTMMLGFVLTAGVACGSVIHSDFDPGGTYYGGIEGWFNYSGMPGFITSTPAGGSTVWLDVKPQQYWGQITSQNWAVPDVTVGTWNSSSSIDFDVIVNSAWIPNNAAQQISVEFQVGGGVNGTVNKYANPTINTSLKDTSQHVSIPLAGLQPFESDASFWNLSVNLIPGYAWEWDSNNPSAVPYDPHYFLDNITWVSAVPEPRSALMILAAVMLMGPFARRSPIICAYRCRGR